MTPTTQFLKSMPFREGLAWYHDYIFPGLIRLSAVSFGPATRVLDIGCGNGSVAREFANRGCKVVGIDMDEDGVRAARNACPAARFEVLPADVNVLENLGEQPFDLVYSLEVIEHLYDPRSFLAGCFAATRSGSRFVCSTPYHGYLKNLAITALDGWDKHHSPQWDGGHIKFFSRKTLSALIEECGFRALEFLGVGRAPYLWKSMMIAAIKP